MNVKTRKKLIITLAILALLGMVVTIVLPAAMTGY